MDAIHSSVTTIRRRRQPSHRRRRCKLEVVLQCVPFLAWGGYFNDDGKSGSPLGFPRDFDSRGQALRTIRSLHRPNEIGPHGTLLA
jgi:hypothetical protein